MTSSQAKFQDDTYFRIIRIMQENTYMIQRELTDKLGIRLGWLNYWLNDLINKGLVKMGNFLKNKNKFKYVYLLTPQGINEKVVLNSQFLKRKIEEYAALKVEIEALKTEVGEDQTDGPRKQVQ